MNLLPTKVVRLKDDDKRVFVAPEFANKYTKVGGEDTAKSNNRQMDASVTGLKIEISLTATGKSR